MEYLDKPCFSCGANLGHLNGCIWDDESFRTQPQTKPKLSREQIIQMILREFFEELNHGK